MSVDAALGRHPRPAHQIDFTIGGEIEEGTLLQQRLDDSGMGQGFQGVMQIHLRQCAGEPPVLCPNARRVDDEKRRAISFHEMFDRFAGEGILGGIEFPCLAVG